MPIWAVAFYGEQYDFAPSRRGVVKAPNEGAAFELVKDRMESAARADLIPQVVADESKIPDGYQEVPVAAP